MTSASSSSTAACPADAGNVYEELGGHAGIRGAVNAVVAAELQNADIASYFFYQSDAGAREGHPNVDQIEECFADFIESALGAGSYPLTLTADAGNGGAAYTCRDLGTAHRDLQIDEGTYVTFLTIAAGKLAGTGDGGLHVSPCLVNVLAGALTSSSVEGAVITNPSDAGLQAFPGSVDAAIKLDATY